LENLINEKKEKNESFTDTEIIRMVANLALGLLEIHSKGIQHRNFKPSNIFISEENEKQILKISNFKN